MRDSISLFSSKIEATRQARLNSPHANATSRRDDDDDDDEPTEMPGTISAAVPLNDANVLGRSYRPP
jgi:hypothetical protein